MEGSITGEASQKAITADSGTPMLSRAAIRGITPQEQKGDSPPCEGRQKNHQDGRADKGPRDKPISPGCPQPRRQPDGQQDIGECLNQIAGDKNRTVRPLRGGDDKQTRQHRRRHQPDPMILPEAVHQQGQWLLRSFCDHTHTDIPNFIVL
ncbi:hypothetical protein GCM10007924_21280 [Sneathiella chinensis]|uniref:Uncharacterized protein n=1 Tax=Sneathiella chinensis TaxID=349750 RepID=A0ABQ5U4A1_9PROT|nr:hypothetical protein GCM10007924_21280 [Sneathiella chinensis]